MLPIVIIAGAALTTKGAIGVGAGIAGAFGIGYAIYSMQLDENTLTTVVLTPDSINILHSSILLQEIKRRYPITQMVNDEDDSIVLFRRNSTTQEQRLSHLKTVLRDFSFKKRAFEEILPQLAAEEAVGKIPYKQGDFMRFEPNDMFRIDRCNIALKDKASTLLGCLIIAYEKQTMSVDNPCLIELDNITNQFNHLLANLSDNVSHYALYSSAFSLAKHIESLKTNYSKIHKSPGFFDCFGHSNRMHTFEEIDFLETISRHNDCDDKLRYAALKVLEQKNWFESRNNFGLRDLLNKGLSHTPLYVNQKICFRMIREFCHNNSIIFPDELQLYFSAVMREQAKPRF